MLDTEKKLPFELENLEKRKLDEIEHSRRRRTILQSSERRADTNKSEEAEGLDQKIRDKEAFEYHFANVKFYSITQSSEDYQYSWLKQKCKQGVKVLDFACGNGENGIFAAQCGADVIGIDISPEGVENSNQNAKEAEVASHCRFEVQDGEAMSFEDNTFDYAVEYGALHHVDLNKALSELARVIKPGGEMICVEALRHNPIIHAYRKRTPHLRTPWEVEHILGVESLDIVKKYFEEVEVKYFHLFALAAVPFRKTFLFKPLRSVFEFFDRILLKPQFIGKYGWIMVFVMKRPRK